MDWALAVAGFGVGGVVGLTGMGGGALMTPILVLFFGIPPLAAVSSDLVASAVMKPVGSAVHIKRGRVDWRLVRWLCLGSVPAAFGGVLVAKALGDSEGVHKVVQIALGVALFLAVIGLLLRAVMRLREQAASAKGLAGKGDAGDGSVRRVKVRPVPTVVLGALGGLVVGMTSVGSGSLIIVALLALYPLLRPNDLVGTDLVQAVPLVAAAALGHILFGDFQFNVTTALLVGSIPGVFLGAQISSRAPGGLIRRALCVVLLASALKLLGASNTFVIVAVLAAIALASVGWIALRRFYGLPAIPRRTSAEPKAPAASSVGASSPTTSPAGPGTPTASPAAETRFQTTSPAAESSVSAASPDGEPSAPDGESSTPGDRRHHASPEAAQPQPASLGARREG